MSLDVLTEARTIREMVTFGAVTFNTMGVVTDAEENQKELLDSIEAFEEAMVNGSKGKMKSFALKIVRLYRWFAADNRIEDTAKVSSLCVRFKRQLGEKDEQIESLRNLMKGMFEECPRCHFRASQGTVSGTVTS
jgi:hypothetical protein